MPNNYEELTNKDYIKYNSIRFLEHFIGRNLGKNKYIKKTLNYLYTKQESRVLDTMKSVPYGDFKQIPVLDDISPQEFREKYMYGSQPFLIKGIAKDWKCVKEWSPEYFAENYGDDVVVLINNHIATDESVEESITLRELIKSWDTDNSKYCRFLPVLHNHPELYEHFDTEWLSKRINKEGKVSLYGKKGKGSQLRSHLFIGKKGMKTEVHCALTNNFFINVYGNKKWYLFSPQYNQFINSPINWGPGVFGSEVDIENRLSDKHRLWRYVDGYEVIMEPGDILYNPPFWWHRVSNLTHNVSIGLRWYDFKSSMKASKTQNILSLLATNPSMLSAVKNAVDYGKTHGKKKKPSK